MNVADWSDEDEHYVDVPKDLAPVVDEALRLVDAEADETEGQP